MPTSSAAIRCDGCGMPASPEHLAERLQRLELATRYRPVHIGVLFVAFAPAAESDFYSSSTADSFLQALPQGLEIASPPATAPAENGDASATLLEFQRRGYYLCYVSECPLPPEGSLLQGAATLARLAPSLVLRIQRNYKPHKIALLGSALRPLTSVLRAARIGPLILDGDSPFEPRNFDDPGRAARFRAACSQR